MLKMNESEYFADEEVDKKNEKQKIRLEKRKRILEDLSQLREEFFRGEWDGLLASSEYELFSIIEILEPLLAGSANIVVHHPNIQVCYVFLYILSRKGSLHIRYLQRSRRSYVSIHSI